MDSPLRVVTPADPPPTAPGTDPLAAGAVPTGALASGEPDWIRIAWQDSRARAYLRTFAQRARPGQFAQRFVAGQVPPMSPLGFFVTGSAIGAVVASLVYRLAGRADEASLVETYFDAIRPYFLFGMIATICHGAMRLLGSRRKLRSTLALALYIGGGPAALARLIQQVTFGPVVLSPGGLVRFSMDHPLLQVGIGLLSIVALVLFLGGFARGLARMHGTRTLVALGVLLPLYAGLAFVGNRAPRWTMPRLEQAIVEQSRHVSEGIREPVDQVPAPTGPDAPGSR